MTRRKTIAEHAYEHCKDRGHPGVGYGDSFLLHEIAEVAGIPHRSWRTERQILNALDRSKQSLFVKRFFRNGRRLTRVFYRFDALPETSEGAE